MWDLSECWHVAAGGEDVDSRRHHLCHAVAATPRDVGLQHPGSPHRQPEVHGPLVPHVRQDLHLHQQAKYEYDIINMLTVLSSFQCNKSDAVQCDVHQIQTGVHSHFVLQISRLARVQDRNNIQQSFCLSCYAKEMFFKNWDDWEQKKKNSSQQILHREEQLWRWEVWGRCHCLLPIWMRHRPQEGDGEARLTNTNQRSESPPACPVPSPSALCRWQWITWRGSSDRSGKS